MDKEGLKQELKKKPDIGEYAAWAAGDSGIVSLLFDIVETDSSSVKFTCEKIIRRISEQKPEVLYPFFERMAKLTGSGNNFIKWGFIQSLPNMIRIDRDGKWEKAAPGYLSLFDSDSVVEFGSAVSGVPKILEGYPQYEDSIIPKLLAIDGHRFLHKNQVSPECVNVAKGHIIDCFNGIYGISKYKEEMTAFAENNIGNSRSSVAKKAKAFLKKYGKA